MWLIQGQNEINPKADVFLILPGRPSYANSVLLLCDPHQRDKCGSPCTRRTLTFCARMIEPDARQ